MTLMSAAPVPLLLLCFVSRTCAVNITSTPGANGAGVVQVQLNGAVTLTCTAEAADGELVWLRNGATVSLREQNKKASSSLCVTPAIHEDNDATFTCHLGSNASETASVTLNVTYPPQASGSEQVAVEKEAQLLLQCDIWANPPVSSVAWTLNGSVVDLVAGGFTVTNDGFSSWLQVHRADQSLHEGTYQCTAHYSINGTHPVPGTYSKEFQVTVTEKTLKFPMMPMIAGVVVVFLTSLLAVVSRWKTITKCCK
ncbi:transmembrane and immunoglobulin domain-containing protein 1 [Cololabis saira]|uniref:transmembrane and immunoglobulin domain-containing protein 1 n=1 Tax=Cololabis saira TaxID=129043 RepID=UPI002AD3EFEB|nr:transmembrane and immunoglobulin domain-containing protein 1 [Cololabis saira]